MWIDEEFSAIEFGDKRLIKRFKQIVEEFMKNAQLNISSMFDSWSSIKGRYRFFSNDKVSAKLILNEHITSTLSRIEQDTHQVLILHIAWRIFWLSRIARVDQDYNGSVAR